MLPQGPPPAWGNLPHGPTPVWPSERAQGYGQPPRPQQSAGTSGKAVVGLVLGLISFCLPVLLSIPAIILGCLALGDTRRGQRGKGLAIAGIATGVLSLVLCPLVSLLTLPLMIAKVREAAARLETVNNLKQIALGFHSYSILELRLPDHAIYDAARTKPLLSWRVTLLKHLGPDEQALYKQFRLDEPWDSPHNSKLIKKMPKVYAHPEDPEASEQGLTYYQVFVGNKAEINNAPWPIFADGPGLHPGLDQIQASDGTSNTFLVVEASKPVPWTAPQDIPYSQKTPLPKLGLAQDYFIVAFADAHVVAINRKDADEQNLRNAITWNDGKAVNLGLK
jgi:hypothetical protein